MTYLITGISGFVAGHYMKYLLANNLADKIIGIDVAEPNLDFLNTNDKKKIEFFNSSLLKTDFIQEVIEQYRPEYVVHLASYSSVAYSWKSPAECFLNNTNIFLNLLEVLRGLSFKGKILSIGSSEEYGVVDESQLPLDEHIVLNPSNPYAVARVAQEQLSQIYAKGYGLNIVCTRSFNHIGPRQKDRFVVSSFVKQVVEVKKGLSKEVICGDLDIIRDFIDVRDVVVAYDILLRKAEAGSIYNVCSGEGFSLKNVLDNLKKISKIDFAVLKNPELIRPIDNPVIIGSCERLKKDFGFKTNYSLRRSLEDILNFWEDMVS